LIAEYFQLKSFAGNICSSCQFSLYIVPNLGFTKLANNNRETNTNIDNWPIAKHPTKIYKRTTVTNLNQ